MATLEGIEARLIALEQSLDRWFNDNDADHANVLAHLDRLNGRTREAERCIAVLQEQQTMRTGALVGLQVIIGGIAAWFGASR